MTKEAQMTNLERIRPTNQRLAQRLRFFIRISSFFVELRHSADFHFLSVGAPL